MKLPDSYTKFRQSIPVNEISYGVGGIKLFTDDEIEKGQVGYSVASDGKTLLSNEEGAWQPSWIAIGYETACGDPLFIDTADRALPVFTAMHGEGMWEPMPMAVSFDAFAQSLKEFARIAKGRSNPVELDEHPLSDNERDAFMKRMAELNEGQFEPNFWDILLQG